MAQLITREELFAAVAKYEQEQVELVLLDLDLDPDATEFPAETIVNVLKVFNTAEAATAMQMQLKGDTQEEAIVLSDAANLISHSLKEENILIPLKTLQYLATGIVNKSFHQADTLIALADEAIVARLKSRQAERTNRLREVLDRQSAETEAILGEEARKKIVQAWSPPVENELDVDAFLAEMKVSVAQDRQAAQSRKAEREAQKVEFDIDAFLAEMKEAQS